MEKNCESFAKVIGGRLVISDGPLYLIERFPAQEKYPLGLHHANYHLFSI
jgi:hypothetical protein